MKKKVIFNILIFTVIMSCTPSKRTIAPPVVNHSDNIISNSTENTMETEQEPEWLIIGGQKVRDYYGDEKYHLKSNTENITRVGVYINKDDKNQANSLDGLEKLVNLQKLYIRSWEWDMLDYSPLNHLRNLQEITFESREEDKPTEIPDLSGLAAREKITKITFTSCALTSLDNIEFLPNLRVVEVERNNGNITDIKPLNKLQHLETLIICADEGSIFNFEEIASLSKLKFLHLDGRQIDAKGIEQLKYLEEIMFSRCNVINTGYLSELKNVRRLEMVILDPEPDITFLKGMESLKRLSITREANIWYYNAQYQVLDLTPLGSLSQLSSLEIRGYILRNVASLDKLDNLVDYYDTDLYGSVLYDSSEKSIKKLNFSWGDR